MFGVQAILSTLVLATVPSPQDATLLFATTPGCGPCKQVAPLVQELARQGYSVETIDATRHPDLIRKLNIDRFPTFLMLSGDTIVDRVVGGGDPIVLKPRIMEMFSRAAQQRKKSGQERLPVSIPATDSKANFAPQPTSPEAAAPAPKVASAAFAPQPVSTETLPPAPPFFGQFSPNELSRNDSSPEKIVPVAFHSPASPFAASAQDSAPFAPMTIGQPLQETETTRQDVSPWILSSVRLRVDAENAHSWGTGTIIDTRNGEALILTCGHIFRDSQGQGSIEVHLFGQQSSVKVFGRCIYYDLEIDLAFVVIAPPCPVRAVPVAPLDCVVRPAQRVWSVGCDGGANPTVRPHQIMSTDRIGTPLENAVPFHYIQVSGAPVSGRSGGGLFTEEGYLIGVCNTADPIQNDGHFVPPEMIRKVLDGMQLTHIYRTPSLVGQSQAATSPIPSTPSDSVSPKSLEPLTIAGRSEMPIDDILNSAANPFSASERPQMNGMNDVERATLDEIKRRTQDGDEVILIVRSRRNPEFPSDVIVLNGTSEHFLDALVKNPVSTTSGDPSYNPVILTSHEPQEPTAPIAPIAIPAASGPQAVSFPVFH